LGNIFVDNSQGSGKKEKRKKHLREGEHWWIVESGEFLPLYRELTFTKWH